MNIKEGICTGIGVIGSIIASAFGGWDTGLVTLFLWELITFQDWWLQVFFTSPTKLNQVHWKAKQDGKDFAGNA
jgi:hypothetical protein